MTQVAVIGMIGVFLALQIKVVKPEFAIYLSIATSILILFFIIDRLSIIIDCVRLLQETISIQGAYLEALIKMIGITYVAEFAADICVDAGYKTIANQIGIFSKLSILAVSMPIITALIETIHGFLGT